jgi:spermidine synthase
MGHTVAAASTVLAAFMGGLAVGSFIAGRLQFIERNRTLRSYAALELFIAAVAIALPVVLRLATPAVASAYADGDAPIRFNAVRMAICLVVVSVPAAAMGATFPIASAWYAHEAADAGLLYAMNTAGAAAGAIAAGF